MMIAIYIDFVFHTLWRYKRESHKKCKIMYIRRLNTISEDINLISIARITLMQAAYICVLCV